MSRVLIVHSTSPAASVSARANALVGAAKASGHAVDVMELPQIPDTSDAALQAIASLRMMDLDFFADALVLLDLNGAAISHRRKLFWLDVPAAHADDRQNLREAVGRRLRADLEGAALREADAVFAADADARASLSAIGVKVQVSADAAEVVEAAAR